MIEFGETLRAAREAKGMTTSDLAEATHMLKSVVEDLENENFTRIAAPIYGRGFVKLYCEAVGIEAKPMIDCFMDIFNGKRDLKIKEREIKPEAITPEPESPAEDLFASPETQEIQPTSPAVENDRQSFSRYSTPLRNYSDSFGSINPRIWRLIILSLAAVAVIWALGAGIRTLYRATTSSEPIETPPEVDVLPAESSDKPSRTEPRAPRKPVDVQPLYIDRIQ